MKIKKSKTVTTGDFISLRKDKICKVRKDTKKGPDGIYFPESNETRMDMDGKIRTFDVPEHIKLKGMFVIDLVDDIK